VGDGSGGRGEEGGEGVWGALSVISFSPDDSLLVAGARDGALVLE
jgi:hypothetical protein